MKKFSQEESGSRGNRHQEKKKKVNKEKKKDVVQSFQIRAETL